MKPTLSLIAVYAALASSLSVNVTAIRIIDASSLTGTPFDPNPNAHVPPPGDGHPHGVPVKIVEDDIKGWMDFLEKYALGVTGTKKQESDPFDKHQGGYVHAAPKHPFDRPPHPHGETEEADIFHILPHNPHPETNLPNWMITPSEFIPPKHNHGHGHGHEESDGLSLPHTGVPDDDWKTMLIAAGIIHPEQADAVAVGSGELPEIEEGMFRGRPVHGHHGHRHGNGQGYEGPRAPARCFFGRLYRAINNLKPLESFFISFVFGMGLASLFRLVYMTIILVRRSHQYVNEVPQVEAPVGSGYPGAESRMRRQREREREELLPAYTESEKKVEGQE